MDQRSPLSCVVFDSSAVMEGMNGRRLMRAFEKHTSILKERKLCDVAGRFQMFQIFLYPDVQLRVR